MPIICGVLAFGMGAGTGASGAQTNLEEVRTSEAELIEQTEAASAEMDDLAHQIEEAEQQIEELAEQEATLLSTIQERDGEVSTLKTENDSLTAKVAELESSASAAPAAPASAPPAAAPSSVYYQNCTAARAAGATPLYRDSPGYASHLDRDGDGVACE